MQNLRPPTPIPAMGYHKGKTATDAPQRDAQRDQGMQNWKDCISSSSGLTF